MGGSVYTFAGGKGGVGKTTVTANVAMALSEKGYDVAAIDADIGMSNLGRLLDVECDCGIGRVLAGEATLDDAVIEGPDGLTLVAGEDDLEAVKNADPANFKDVINPLAESHDIVLVDTGANLNHQNLVAYGLADAVALVTTATKVALGDIERTKEMVEHVDGTVAGAVVTRHRSDSDQPDPDKIATYLDTNLLAAVPDYSETQPREPLTKHGDGPAVTKYGQLATAFSVHHQSDSAGTETEADEWENLRADDASQEDEKESAGRPEENDDTADQQTVTETDIDDESASAEDDLPENEETPEQDDEETNGGVVSRMIGAVNRR